MTIFYKNFTSNGAHTLHFVPLTSSRLDGAITCLGVVSLELLQHIVSHNSFDVCYLEYKSIMLEFARGNVESCNQDSKTPIPKVQHKNSHNNFTNLLDPNTREL